MGFKLLIAGFGLLTGTLFFGMGQLPIHQGVSNFLVGSGETNTGMLPVWFAVVAFAFLAFARESKLYKNSRESLDMAIGGGALLASMTAILLSVGGYITPNPILHISLLAGAATGIFLHMIEEMYVKVTMTISMVFGLLVTTTWMLPVVLMVIIPVATACYVAMRLSFMIADRLSRGIFNSTG